jgi:signal transduction histidine kinase
VSTRDDNEQHARTAELASAFSASRKPILKRWRSRVAAEISAAATLDEPVLVNMVPKLYDNIAEALSKDSPVAVAIAGSNVATAHGRERANMTNYSPHDVVHELQIFREVLFSITKANGLTFSKHSAEVIGHLIEEAARESISGFSEADREKSVDFIASLSHDLRNPLNVANASAQLIQLKTSDRLFNPYQRTEDTSVKGWGLGLPYVQNVAESHGGTVVIDSDVSRGTTFTVSIPIDARPYVQK